MPKGDLSRDQLSSLLLAHLGTASDIVDFTSVLSEDMTYSPRFVHTVLILWTLSLLQFPFVVTATSGDFADNDQDDTRELRVEASNDQNTSPDASTKMSSKRCSLRQFGYSAKRHCHTFIETEAWGIIVSVLMQDGPFLLLRLVSMSEYQIFTYSNIFFASKNALVLLLQGYRLYCLFIERQEEKRRIERERQRAWRRIVFIDRISSVYTNINDAWWITDLTHWGLLRHICIIGLGHHWTRYIGLSPVRRHTITWTNTNILSAKETYFNKIALKLKRKIFTMTQFKCSSTKYRLLGFGISVLYRLSMGCHTVSSAPVWVRIPGP